MSQSCKVKPNHQENIRGALSIFFCVHINLLSLNPKDTVRLERHSSSKLGLKLVMQKITWLTNGHCFKPQEVTFQDFKCSVNSMTLTCVNFMLASFLDVWLAHEFVNVYHLYPFNKRWQSNRGYWGGREWNVTQCLLGAVYLCKVVVNHSHAMFFNCVQLVWNCSPSHNSWGQRAHGSGDTENRDVMSMSN